MTDRDTDLTTSLVNGAAAAMALVETVDEAWLYREAAQSRAERADAVSQSVLHSPDETKLLVYNADEPCAWIQCDEYLAVGR